MKAGQIRVAINGTPLSQAQVTSLYMALQHFSCDLQQRGLGNDEHGRRMTALYLARLAEVNVLMKAGAAQA